MKTWLIAAGLILAGTAALADPVEGVWRTQPDDNGNHGHVQIVSCGTAFCGTLVRAFDGRGQQIESPNVGKRIVWDMEAKGGGNYGGGKIWSPDRDKTYNSKMKLSGDGLVVQGCILGICREGGSWSRVK